MPPRVANQSAIELHPFLARGELHERPTHVVFDLDPGHAAGILDCCRVALRLREVLAERGLSAFAKTTGSVGLHVVVPLNTPHDYTHTKGFAREVATRLQAEDPARVTASARAERSARVFVDWLGNDRSRSTIAPYSLRATDLPTVSTPLAWEEVEDAHRRGSADALRFLDVDVLRRIEASGDPLSPALELRQRLPLLPRTAN